MSHNTADIIIQYEIALSIQVPQYIKLRVISKVLFDNYFATEIEVNSTITLPHQCLKLQKIQVSTTLFSN